MLAIAAPSFAVPSETFIRDHVRSIAPGRTILLCHNEDGVAALGCPVLITSRGSLARRTFHSIIATAQRRFRPEFFRYSRQIPREERCRIANFLHSHKVAALLAEFGPTGVEFAAAAHETHIPLFVHFHGADASSLLRFPLLLQDYQNLFLTAAGIIAPSHFIADNLARIGCPRGILHVSPCGVDLARFSVTQRIPSRLLSVGRLTEKKAPHLTIEAFAKVAEQNPDARLDVVGTGPLDTRCRNIIARRGLGTRVFLHGEQNHEFVARMMGQCSVFVQHSVTAPDGDVEGLPVAILEAMAAAIPIVATRHSGIPEAVLHSVTGLLVRERDVEGMASAIEYLLSNPRHATEMGHAGRIRAMENFSLDRTRDRLRSLMGLCGGAIA